MAGSFFCGQRRVPGNTTRALLTAGYAVEHAMGFPCKAVDWWGRMALNALRPARRAGS
jgi:hypothetical protein